MANPVGKLGYRLISIAVGIPMGILARKLVGRIWLSARPDDPPREPSDPNVSWADALGWAALSAAGVAVAELFTLKGASALWRVLTGSEPPTKKSADKSDGAGKDNSRVHKDAKALSSPS